MLLKELLKEIIDNRGKNPPEYVAYGIPVIDNYLIDNNFHPNLTRVNRYISTDTYNNFIRKKTIENDLLITLVGNGYGNITISPKNTIIIQNTIGLRTNEKICLSKYLYYLLLNQKTTIRNLNRGCAQPSIKVSDLLSIDLNIHSLPEQKHIVDTIGSIDDLIEKYEKIVNKLLKNAKLFYLKNISNNVVPLGDLINIFDNIRKPLSSNERKGNKIYPYYGATQIIDYVDEYLFDGEYILLAEDGTVINDDETPVIQFITGKNWVGNHAHVLNSKGILNLYSLYFILQQTNVKEAITGAVQLKINQENLKKIIVNLPNNIDEYNNYSKSLMTIILKYKNKLSKLYTLKKHFLDKYFR
ncbi:MAG: restriction endonuclease subunit S [Acholeplasmatales bacterium]|nr:restriction endonuclease subunit S [Acholeplasmatales bacterium]